MIQDIWDIFHLIIGRKLKADDAQIRGHYILQHSIKRMLFLAICYKPLKGWNCVFYAKYHIWQKATDAARSAVRHDVILCSCGVISIWPALLHLLELVIKD